MNIKLIQLKWLNTYGNTIDGNIESLVSALICRGLYLSMSRLRRPHAVVNVTKPEPPDEVENKFGGMQDCTVAITAVDVIVEKTVLVNVVTVRGLKLKKELGSMLVTKNFFWAFLTNGILACMLGIEESMSPALYSVCK